MTVCACHRKSLLALGVANLVAQVAVAYLLAATDWQSLLLALREVAGR